jgi:hypothetical protein
MTAIGFQELGLAALIKLGVRVVTASGNDLTDTSDPSRVMMRQIVGSFAEYEKARLVASSRRLATPRRPPPANARRLWKPPRN